uniref:Uncharacterized protein n=1 Tax=Chenopodium quinoa TaxID=63459 RepID=A0A803NCA4_CHEQI
MDARMVVASVPVLKLPIFDIPFEVHTYASDGDIGGVQEIMDKDRDSLAKAQRRMKKQVDKSRRPLEFQVRDLVMTRIGNVAYSLELPERIKVHPTLHEANDRLGAGGKWPPDSLGHEANGHLALHRAGGKWPPGSLGQEANGRLALHRAGCKWLPGGRRQMAAWGAGGKWPPGSS